MAIEVFPKAFEESGYSTGIAVALGLVLALFLDKLGSLATEADEALAQLDVGCW